MQIDLYEHVWTLIHVRRPAEAERECRRILVEYPDDSEGHAVLANAVCLQGRKSEALEIAREAVRLQPDSAFAHYMLAHVLQRANQRRKALAAIDEALRLCPSYAGFHGLQAAILNQLGNYHAGRDAAERGLECDPRDVSCANHRALALRELGELGESLATSRRALEIAPEDDFTHYNYALTLERANLPREAATHFREALRLDPGDDSAESGFLRTLHASGGVYRLGVLGLIRVGRMNPIVRALNVLIGLMTVVFADLIVAKSPDFPQAAPPGFIFLVVVFAVFSIADLLVDLSRFSDPLAHGVVSSGWLAYAPRPTIMAVVVALAAVALAALGFVKASVGTIGALAMARPLVIALGQRAPGSRRAMLGYAAAVGAVGVWAWFNDARTVFERGFWLWALFFGSAACSGLLGRLMQERSPAKAIGRGAAASVIGAVGFFISLIVVVALSRGLGSFVEGVRPSVLILISIAVIFIGSFLWQAVTRRR